jgi:8-oxo-dGTP pyrophosphatase MutT (NUDIX family)
MTSQGGAKKVFYAGGFFYNPENNRVLLHRRDFNTPNNPGQWAFFGGTSEVEESPMETFLREIREELGITLTMQEVVPLCDYFNPDFDTHRYVFYVVSDIPVSVLTLREGAGLDWIELDEIFSLNLSKRTRQDLETFVTGVLPRLRSSV